jgi:hypothetical protein
MGDACKHIGQWRMYKDTEGSTVTRRVLCLDCGACLYREDWPLADVEEHVAQVKRAAKAAIAAARGPLRTCIHCKRALDAAGECRDCPARRRR